MNRKELNSLKWVGYVPHQQDTLTSLVFTISDFQAEDSVLFAESGVLNYIRFDLEERRIVFPEYKAYAMYAKAWGRKKGLPFIEPATALLSHQ